MPLLSPISDRRGCKAATQTRLPNCRSVHLISIIFRLKLYNFIYDHHRTALNTPIGPKVVKMEQVPTASPAKEKQPVRPLMNGYLNDVFSIFKARQHPFILLEESALRWMGLRVSPEEVNITSPSPAASRC